MSISEGIYIGEIAHKRFSPKIHTFKYKHIMISLDIDSAIDKNLSKILFGINKFGFLSINAKNHLGGKYSDLRSSLSDILKNNNTYNPNHKMIIMTTPSVFGHVFNPATFYFQIDNKKNVIELIIVEVNNTFGEGHTYILNKLDINKNTYTYHDNKSFHVSPFADMEGEYKFKFILNNEYISTQIDLIKDNSPFIIANFTGKYEKLSNLNLLKNIIRITSIVYLTELRILIQAYKLMIVKKLKFYQKPSPSSKHTFTSSAPSYINSMKFIKWIKKFSKNKD